MDLAAFLQQEPEVLRAQLNREGYSGPWNQLPGERVRSTLEQKGYRIPRRVVSFQMLKGGVAKTTSALHFGVRAAQYGARVLMLDLDQQANLSFALGVDASSLPVWVDVIEKKATLPEVIVPLFEGLDLIPSNLNNSVLDRVLLNSHRNWAQSVRQPLRDIRNLYDLIVIDTAPQLSALNAAVSVASDLVVLPVSPDRFSLMGARKHLEDLEQLRKEFDLQFDTRVLITKFDGREALAREILHQCIDIFEGILMKNYVRQSAVVKGALGDKLNLFSQSGPAKEDFDAMTREIMNWV